MAKRDIIVIGASSGGFDVLKQLVAKLPPNLQASIFIVWHLAPDVQGVLPQVLNKQKTIRAANAVDKEKIVSNRIYVAPPDNHLLIENGFVRVTKGPKENRFRPAVDPLFRSAAYAYGPRVIGVVLSGSLNDGTAGLWAIKNRAGIAIVQDPNDAEFPSMPASALNEVEVDYKLDIESMAQILVKLCSEEVMENIEVDKAENEKSKVEIDIAMGKEAISLGVMQLGEPTPFTCSECHGTLLAVKDGPNIRYRCHTGHAYSSETLLSALSETIENSLWNAIRGIEEGILLLNGLGDHLSASNQPKIAAAYFKKAKDAESRAKLVRRALYETEDDLTA